MLNKSRIVGALACAGLTITGCSQGDAPKKDAVIESYKPEKTVEFPHDIHTGQNGIDCAYCHAVSNPAKPAKVPKEICANCHRQVVGKPAADTLHVP
jgi:hypothetical protein